MRKKVTNDEVIESIKKIIRKKYLHVNVFRLRRTERDGRLVLQIHCWEESK